MSFIKSTSIKILSPISPNLKDNLSIKENIIERLVAKNYMSIEFKYYNAAITSLNIFLALYKMKNNTKN